MTTRPPLPEPPAAYQYLFDSYYGEVWRDDSANWNGSKPKATRTLHTAEQVHAYADACVKAETAALRDRIQKMSETMIGMDAYEAGLAEAQAYLMTENKALREQLTLAETVRASQVAGLVEGSEHLRERVAVLEDALRDIAGTTDGTDCNNIANAVLYEEKT